MRETAESEDGKDLDLVNAYGTKEGRIIGSMEPLSIYKRAAYSLEEDS